MIEHTLTPREVEKLRQVVVGGGTYETFMHRLQQGLRGNVLRIRVDDLPLLVHYWRQDRKGGFQVRFPIRSLARFLPTSAPLFMGLEGPPQPTPPPRSIYFAQDGLHRIKIGVTKRPHHRGGGFRTDNADRLVALLVVEESATENERVFHRQFEALRIRGEQEWFWPGEDLLAFIAARRKRRP